MRRCVLGKNTLRLFSRGGVEDTRLEAKDTKKNPRPRPRTALPRTDPLEAKDRNDRGQGQGPKTQAQVFSKKKGLEKIFSGDLQKKRSWKKIFRRSPKKKLFKKIFRAFSSKKRLLKFFFRRSTKKNVNNSKKVLSSSRGQANFRGLEASRPRTSKGVLEAKDVLEDCNSVIFHWGQTVYSLWWPSRTKDFPPQAKKRVLCVSVARQTQCA